MESFETVQKAYQENIRVVFTTTEFLVNIRLTY